VRAVVPPTVPSRRVRVCLHAGNTEAEVLGLVKRVERWMRDQLKNEQAERGDVELKARL